MILLVIMVVAFVIIHCFFVQRYFIRSKLLVVVLLFGATSNINICNCC